MSLSTRFLIASAGVVCGSMAILGSWVSAEIAASALTSTAMASAVYMEAFFEPQVQDLADDGKLSAETIEALDRVLERAPLGGRLFSIKIWSLDGTVVYSSGHQMIGQTFNVADVETAASGKVVASFDKLHEPESALERAAGLPLIEVYAPLYAAGSDEVIAVGEYYERAPWFEEQIAQSRTKTWIEVGFLTAGMIGILFLIVVRGSSTINAQREQLREQVNETAAIAALNEELRVMADKARLDASEANEQLLARIGSDIHDGPIQMLGLLMLKLSSEDRQSDSSDAHAPLQITAELLAELRNISAGLSLPEISAISLRDALRLAITRHEDLTGTKVTNAVGNLPNDVSQALKTCAYRVVQEGLSNSFKHAGEVPTTVEASAADGMLTITVTDAGAARGVQQRTVGSDQKLGLAGIRNRVSALKGTVEIEYVEGQGMQLQVTLPLKD